MFLFAYWMLNIGRPNDRLNDELSGVQQFSNESNEHHPHRPSDGFSVIAIQTAIHWLSAMLTDIKNCFQFKTKGSLSEKVRKAGNWLCIAQSVKRILEMTFNKKLRIIIIFFCICHYTVRSMMIILWSKLCASDSGWTVFTSSVSTFWRDLTKGRSSNNSPNEHLTSPRKRELLWIPMDFLALTSNMTVSIGHLI